MSVINSVLRDLEAREARFTPLGFDALERPPAESGLRRPLFAALALTLLTALAAGLLWRTPAPRGVDTIGSAIEPAALAAVALKALPAAPPVEPAAPRNRIVGLQLRETGEGLRLEFALRERPVGYLRHSAANRFGYHLRAVDSDIEAPRIEHSDWLETLTLGARAGGIDIDFVTAPGVLVETRQARVDDQPAWIIQLRRPAAVAPADAIESPAPADSAPRKAPVAAIAAQSETPIAAAKAPSINVAPAATGADEVRLDIRSTDPAAPDRNRLQYATELINAGRLGDAEALLAGLLDGPEDRAAREHLLALYQLAARPRDFATLARASAARYPDATVFVTEHARVLMQAAAYAEVVALLAPATDLDADRHALLAAAYQRLDRHADAIRHYELAIARAADDARHWIGLGISQEQVAAPGDALNSYRTAARLGPPSERLRAFVAKRANALERVLD